MYAVSMRFALKYVACSEHEILVDWALGKAITALGRPQAVSENSPRNAFWSAVIKEVTAAIRWLPE